jgi:hypothetical protein
MTLLSRLLFFAALLGAFSFAGAQTVNERAARANFGTFTAAAATNAFDVSYLVPTHHSFAAIVTGAPATCTVQLEGSLDGTNWFALTAATTCTSSVFASAANYATDYVRLNLTALTGGSSPTVSLRYLGAQ